MPKIKTVLFDLDGTLADTAPDLANALNHVLVTNNLEPLPFETIRPEVSNGGIALIKLGFGENHPEFKSLHKEFLEYYQDNIAKDTVLFPGMEELLEQLENKNINWGIVTNKPSYLTDPLLKALNLTSRSISIVSGDTLEHNKPHPAPLLFACEQAGCNFNECIYIGDAERDIEAANRADMLSIVALFGYIAETDTPENWGADAFINSPLEILALIESLS